jgi:hypothetical protein
MAEKMSDRERLSWEVGTLDDDQVREVLEYISIMRALQRHDVDLRKSDGKRIPMFDRPESASVAPRAGEVLIFPGSRRAASK